MGGLPSYCNNIVFLEKFRDGEVRADADTFRHITNTISSTMDVEFEKTLLVKFRFHESEVGLTAWGEVIPLLTLRLDGIPIAMFPSINEPLKIFFGADAFRLYKDNSTKAVLCVVKAMIQRTDLEGNRLQGWAINSAMNCIKAAIYEGGDSYVEMSTKGLMIQKQLVKSQQEGPTIHKERDT